MIDIVEKIYTWEGIFNTYKVTDDNGEISFVPVNEANKDYQAIQEWIADGGTVIDNGV